MAGKKETDWGALTIGLAVAVPFVAGWAAIEGGKAVVRAVAGTVDKIRTSDNSTLIDENNPYTPQTGTQVVYRSDIYQPTIDDPHQAQTVSK